uniref:Sodium channel modifier 1 n=1 Tax=Cyprinus carpio TaxID=7962 RepID=A0A8C2GWM8_CYPCA
MTKTAKTTRCRSSNFIPDDEATLMKNGSCLVCSHRPVFDTVDMLMVHRKGKRHLEGMKWFYGKKNHLQREINKRRHQDDVKDDQHSVPLSQTRKITHHALLRSAPYSSCHRKARDRLKKTETKRRKNGSSTVCEPQTDERRNTFKLNCVRDDEIVSSHSSHMSSL